MNDTIKVIVHEKGSLVRTPDALDHKHAVCRISAHRVSGSEVTARFRALQVQKVTFGSVASKNGHAPLMVGYAKIESAASASRHVSGSARSGCTAREPVWPHHNPWPRAKRQMAPRGAWMIQLCRYSGERLVGSHRVLARYLRHQIISRLDALKPYRGRPPHCPIDKDRNVWITLFYKRGHRVDVVVHISGCPIATNGDIRRPAWNTAAGGLLVKQVKALTPRHPR